jgi:hypothetical protein
VKCYGLFVKKCCQHRWSTGRSRNAGLSRTLNAEQGTVLKNVNVIDGTGAPVQPNTTVVIESDRIRSIATEQTDTPPNAKWFSQGAPLYRCTGEGFFSDSCERVSISSFGRGHETTLWQGHRGCPERFRESAERADRTRFQQVSPSWPVVVKYSARLLCSRLGA